MYKRQLLTRDGEKLVDEPTGRYDASIYADCFALIGSAQYAKMTQNTEAADVAHRLYRSITKRVESGDFLTEPYPVPDGYQVHGIPMILVNTVQEYMDCLLYTSCWCWTLFWVPGLPAGWSG